MPTGRVAEAAVPDGGAVQGQRVSTESSPTQTLASQHADLHTAHEQMVARLAGEQVVVEVDADLTLRVAMSDDGVKVLLEGSAEAIEPLRDMESALRDDLESDGQDLLDFTARQRASDDDKEEPARRSRFLTRQTKLKSRAPVGRGQLLNAVA